MAARSRRTQYSSARVPGQRWSRRRDSGISSSCAGSGFRASTIPCMSSRSPWLPAGTAWRSWRESVPGVKSLPRWQRRTCFGLPITSGATGSRRSQSRFSIPTPIPRTRSRPRKSSAANCRTCSSHLPSRCCPKSGNTNGPAQPSSTRMWDRPCAATWVRCPAA